MKFTAYNQFVADLGKGGIRYAAEHCSSLGFESVEFLDFCGTATPLNKEKYPAEEVKAVLAEYGLSVACYSVYCNMHYEDREYVEAEIRRQIDYAAAVGSPYFHHTIIPGIKVKEGMPAYDEVFEDIAAREEALADYCAEKGISLIIEPQGLYFNGTEGLGRLFERLTSKHDNVGFCADVGNSLFVDCEPVEVFKLFAPMAKHAHAKDYIRSDEPLELKGAMRSPKGKWLYDTAIGNGCIDFKGCFSELKKNGYNGSIAIEITCNDEDTKATIAYLKNIWNEA